MKSFTCLGGKKGRKKNKNHIFHFSSLRFLGLVNKHLLIYQLHTRQVAAWTTAISSLGSVPCYQSPSQTKLPQGVLQPLPSITGAYACCLHPSTAQRGCSSEAVCRCSALVVLLSGGLLWCLLPSVWQKYQLLFASPWASVAVRINSSLWAQDFLLSGVLATYTNTSIDLVLFIILASVY